MGFSKDKVVEIFLGAIFIILIIIMILLFTNGVSGSSSKTQGTTTTTTITNSFNTNTYTNYGFPSGSYNNYEGGYNYIDHNYGKESKKQYLRYSSRGRNDKDYGNDYGIFSGKVDDYSVYVKNTEHKGGYFTTKFYITDYYGKTKTDTITHYLKPHEEKKFMYRNVLHNGDEYKYWKYNVESHTRR